MSLISSDPPCKDVKHGKACLIKYQLDIIIFNCGSSIKATCAFLLRENIWELPELNTFKPNKMKISSTLLIR